MVPVCGEGCSEPVYCGEASECLSYGDDSIAGTVDGSVECMNWDAVVGV